MSILLGIDAAEMASRPTCMFGEQVVSAILEGERTITCASTVSSAGTISLEVSLNAQYYSTSGGAFCVLNASHTSLSPSSGPIAGGTQLLARGVGLVPHGCHALMVAEPKMRMIQI